MYKVEVIVKYKKGILNPEAKTINNALRSLGYNSIKNVQSGKYFELTFPADLKKSEVENTTDEVCHKLLSNPVIEDYTYKIEKEQE
ncbi:MAG: phosphoribosylformylglycinamidine synthase subunit PurS [Candidatus Marinimicrobia bacterium]|nr:phosphoribosylformylglycinamidine synthase subunit PurS [Candidatus Neomarinimicrobiota bacterium]